MEDSVSSKNYAERAVVPGNWKTPQRNCEPSGHALALVFSWRSMPRNLQKDCGLNSCVKNGRPLWALEEVHCCGYLASRYQ